MDQARGGDERAIAILVSLVLPDLERYVAINASDLSTADHEAIAERGAEEAVRKIAKFDRTRGSFPRWARLYARTLIRDFRRHPERWGAPPHWNVPISIEASRRRRINLRRALGLRSHEGLDSILEGLRPGYAEVLRLRDTGLSHAQIARELGIKEGAARTRLCRAVARAKKLAAKRDPQGSSAAA